jgi:hypothetical protein
MKGATLLILLLLTAAAAEDADYGDNFKISDCTF